jgi:hypothetical protein
MHADVHILHLLWRLCKFLTPIPEDRQFKEGFEPTGMLCYWSKGGWRVARPQKLRANSVSLFLSH